MAKSDKTSTTQPSEQPASVPAATSEPTDNPGASDSKAAFQSNGDSPVAPAAPLSERRSDELQKGVAPGKPSEPIAAVAAELAPSRPAVPQRTRLPDGHLNFKVWPHGSLRLPGGVLHPPGAIVPLTPELAAIVNAKSPGLLTRASVAGRECPRCGEGTGAEYPCSLECFTAAGYPAEDYEHFVQRRTEDRERRIAGREAAPPSSTT